MMLFRTVKCLMVAVFSLFYLSSCAQEKEPGNRHINMETLKNMDKEGTKKFDANEVIFGHVLDAHQFHFLSYKGSDGRRRRGGGPRPGGGGAARGGRAAGS